MKDIYNMTDNELLINYYHYIKSTTDKYAPYSFSNLVKEDLENYLIEKINYFKTSNLDSHISGYLNRMLKLYLKRFENTNDTIFYLMIKYPQYYEVLKPLLGYNLLKLSKKIIEERNLVTNEYINSTLLIIINDFIEEEISKDYRKMPKSIETKFLNKIKNMPIRDLVYAFDEKPDNIDLIEQKYSYFPYLKTEKYNGILNKKIVFEEFNKKYLSLVERLDSYDIDLNKYFGNNLTMQDYKVHRLENRLYRNCHKAGKTYIDMHSQTKEENNNMLSNLPNLIDNYMKEGIESDTSFVSYIKTFVR